MEKRQEEAFWETIKAFEELKILFSWFAMDLYELIAQPPYSVHLG